MFSGHEEPYSPDGAAIDTSLHSSEDVTAERLYSEEGIGSSAIQLVRLMHSRFY
jgi:hypothetical protein